MSDSRDALHTETDAATASLADYIADMARELATMAERSELTMLAYFLNLARVEAEAKARELSASDVAEARGRA
ncbi:hypothetical+protein [Methylocapsa aurea]|jgi:hypothetical protein|uniref:hypothetical protein n=1 Tax=Methylocapsa aurea TaxID=663610 RepID=UPI003D18E616